MVKSVCIIGKSLNSLWKNRLVFGFMCFLAFVFWGGTPVFAQNWREIITVEDLYRAHPDQLDKLLESLNLDYPGLEKVKEAYELGQPIEACEELLVYYQNSNHGTHLRRDNPGPSEKTIASADTLLENVFVIQNVRGQLPWKPDGHRDWHYKGPNDDREWAWLSNRHFQISQVLNAYFQTGNPRYVRYIDLFLRDFIIDGWPYPEKKSNTSVWRGLEVAARAKNWTNIFYSLQDNELFTPATRLLILASLVDHAHYGRHFHSENNWLTMEISALATIAADFPEFKLAPQWLDYAAKTIAESMKGQVYPDGTQTELTSHYHSVAMLNFVLFNQICERANYTMPAFFDETIEKMYEYVARTVRPDGSRILNNDGDRVSDVALISKGAEAYNKPEWLFIATNGEQGREPDDGPSYFYPGAGHLISRSGFDREAHWSFFDVGPWGSGHQHNDKLHLSIAAFGRDFLVDAGRFAYTGMVAEKFRGYARGSQGHNVVLIDGKGQAPGPKLAEEPVPGHQWAISDQFDFAWSSMEGFIEMEGKVEHRRGVYYQRGEFWIVIDQINSDRPRKVDALWHWHPDCDVTVDGSKTYTKHQFGNLQIVPGQDLEWEIQTIVGQEEPEIQGWYSVEYNKYTPNPAVIYSTDVPGKATFVWLIHPTEGPVEEASVELLSVDDEKARVKVVTRSGGERMVTIPVKGWD